MLIPNPQHASHMNLKVPSFFMVIKLSGFRHKLHFLYFSSFIFFTFQTNRAARIPSFLINQTTKYTRPHLIDREQAITCVCFMTFFVTKLAFISRFFHCLARSTVCSIALLQSRIQHCLRKDDNMHKAKYIGTYLLICRCNSHKQNVGKKPNMAIHYPLSFCRYNRGHK